MAKYVMTALSSSSNARSQVSRRQKVNHQAIAPTYERAGVFPFFDLPAEIRNMIYVLIFTTNSFIGHLCADVMQWVFVNFAREYRVIRQFERAMVNKQFWWESMTIFFSMNTFELHAFKALDSFLSHIGPTAASMIKYLRVFPRCDDPFPALCHLSVATGLKRLHIEISALVRKELLRFTLANAKEVILDNHDVLEFYVTDEISGLVMGPSELDPALLPLRFNCCSIPLTKLYDALTNFVFKKLNGEYKAYAPSSPFILLHFPFRHC